MKKIILKIIYIFIIICLITGCEATVHKEKPNILTSYTVNYNLEENINVSIRTYLDYNQENLIVYLTNNNDYNIKSIKAEINCSDELGNNIGYDSKILRDFVKKGEYVFTLELPEDAKKKYLEEIIDISIKIEEKFDEVDSITTFNNSIETSYTKVDDEIHVSVKNTSGVKLPEVEIAAIFLKDNTPIYVENIKYILDIEESKTKDIDIPEKELKEDKDILVDYDSIELIVNRASTR